MSASCTLYATMEMTCPLCRAVVPANTRHHCEKPDPWRDLPQPPGHVEAAEESAAMTKRQQQAKTPKRTTPRRERKDPS